MNWLSSLSDFAPFVAIRRDIHAHPELGFEGHRNAKKVPDLLAALGIEVHAGATASGP
jgi:hypothetical protein